MSQLWANLGTGGTALDARNGSGTGVDSNDAKLLEHDGTNYVYLPGVAGNYMSTPDAAALDITGNLSMVADIAADDWTPSASFRIGGKEGAYVWVLGTSGTMTFTYVDSGSVVRTVASSDPVGFVDGERKQLGVSYVAGTGINDVRFWTRSTSSDAWAQLGTTLSSGGVSILAGTGIVAIGATNTGASPFTGRVHRFAVYGTVGSGNTPASTLPVLDVDTSVITSGAATSFTATTGQTVTISRSTSGRKSVAVVNDVWLLGTANYLEIADNDLLDFGASDSFTVMVAMRQWNNFVSTGGLVDKGAPGYHLRNGGGTPSQTVFLAYDSAGGLGSTAPNTKVSGALSVVGAVVGTSTMQAFSGTNFATATARPAGSLAGSTAFFIGRYGAGYVDAELMAVAVFRRALSASEIAALSTYYATRFP